MNNENREPVRVTYTLTQDEYIAFLKTVTGRALLPLVLVVGIAAILFALADGGPEEAILVAVVVIVVFALIWSAIRKTWKRQFSQNVMLNDETTITLDDDGLHVDSESTSALLRWKAYEFVQVAKQFFLIKQRGQAVYTLVPLRAFSSEDDQSAFLDMFRTHDVQIRHRSRTFSTQQRVAFGFIALFLVLSLGLLLWNPNDSSKTDEDASSVVGDTLDTLLVSGDLAGPSTEFGAGPSVVYRNYQCENGNDGGLITVDYHLSQPSSEPQLTAYYKDFLTGRGWTVVPKSSVKPVPTFGKTVNGQDVDLALDTYGDSTDKVTSLTLSAHLLHVNVCK